MKFGGLNKNSKSKLDALFVNDKIAITGSLVLTIIILLLFIFFTGTVFGTFLFNLAAKETKAELQRIVYLKADTCGMPNEPKKIKSVLATAYSSTPGQTDDTPCITATGYDVCANYALYGSDNTIASNFLPVHTLVKIPELYGDKIFVVRDRMNARYGYNNIDIWMPTYSKARNFGVKQVTIEIY
jgi:3D (Asp-Asp-Asp) domain-containing protein